MKKALIVGIDDYKVNPLKGCVNDAKKIKKYVSRNADGSKNFTSKLLTSNSKRVTEAVLMNQIRKLFSGDDEMALLYFSGHGAVDPLGGFLVTQDAEKHNLGVSLNSVIGLANYSKVKEIIILLDCCYSGYAGINAGMGSHNVAMLRKGVSILSSSEKNELSKEKNGGGIFTQIVCEAMEGKAADLLGNVTIANVFDFADKLLGPWDQRPVFKTHTSNSVSLRTCKPRIEPELLNKLTVYFKHADYRHRLSPDYEPTAEPHDKEKEAIFGDLQKLTAASLVKPIGEEHMYYAAINSKSCGLTLTGKAYWKMIRDQGSF